MKMSPRFASAVFLVCIVTFLGCSSSIHVPDKQPAVAPTFSMIIAADPQYPWWTAPPCHCNADECASGKCEAGVCDGDRKAIVACESRIGGDRIREQIQAASKVGTLDWPWGLGGGRITAPVGVIVNGDLTAYFHFSEVMGVNDLINQEMKKIHDADPHHPMLNIIPFLGLGNHDYRNNVCDCRSWSPHDLNICARNAAHLMYRLYDRRYPWIRFDPCSLAYSWTFNNIRFVQLHLWPGYTADLEAPKEGDTKACLAMPNRFSPAKRPCNDSVVFPSWDFLESELTAADVNHQRSVLLFHDPDEYWSDADVAKFRAIVARHDVIAMFAGHHHGVWGVQTGFAIAHDLKNVKGDAVKLMLSGAAEGQRFIVAEFTPTSMKASVVTTKNGVPEFDPPSDAITTRLWFTW